MAIASRIGSVVLLVTTMEGSAVNWPIVTLTSYVTGLASPVDIAYVGDGSGRLFVVQQSGQILMVTNGTVAGTFLDISGRILSGGEQGLLGVAFPAGFATGRHFYVSYTDTGGTSVISRFWLATGNNNLADANSEEQILRVHQPFANHNGGQIGFSPSNGYLYVGFGDGGSGNDPSHSNSVFKFFGSVPNNAGAFTVRWFSETGRTYAISRSTNLLDNFSMLSTNLVATPPLNAYTDAVSVNARAFYRVKAAK
jgi:hypothetical protein